MFTRLSNVSIDRTAVAKNDFVFQIMLIFFAYTFFSKNVLISSNVSHKNKLWHYFKKVIFSDMCLRQRK